MLVWTTCVLLLMIGILLAEASSVATPSKHHGGELKRRKDGKTRKKRIKVSAPGSAKTPVVEVGTNSASSSDADAFLVPSSSSSSSSSSDSSSRKGARDRDGIDEDDDEDMGDGPTRVDQRVMDLRARGIEYIGLKKYWSAAKCYIGAMQLMEKSTGDAARDLRRRCALTLAECYIKCGRYQEAIARCSEVIDEAPQMEDLLRGVDASADFVSVGDGGDQEEENSTENRAMVQERELLLMTVAKAYLRRGMCLQHVGRSDLGLLDITRAKLLVPTDEVVERTMTRMLEATRAGSIVRDEEERVSTEEDQHEQLQDLLEQMQLDHPPEPLSVRDISRLLTQSPRSERRGRDNVAGMGGTGGDVGAGTAGPLGRGGALLGGPAGAVGGNPMAGLAAMLGGLGGGNMGVGGVGGLKGLAGMLPLVGNMLGLDHATIRNVKDIFEAFMDVGQAVQRGLALAKKYSSEVVMVVTTAWAMATIYINP